MAHVRVTRIADCQMSCRSPDEVNNGVRRLGAGLGPSDMGARAYRINEIDHLYIEGSQHHRAFAPFWRQNDIDLVRPGYRLAEPTTDTQPVLNNFFDGQRHRFIRSSPCTCKGVSRWHTVLASRASSLGLGAGKLSAS